jgi:lipid-binding SYLF domain-containing protein
MDVQMNRILFLALVCMVFVAACTTTKGNTGDEKRIAIQKMKRDTLDQLYQKKPDVRSQIADAVGYGVFSNASVYILIVGAGGGYGVVENRESASTTYMKMGEIGVGIGIGAKDYRLVMVFHTQDAMDYFIKHGWSFGGQADAAAKAGEKGGAVGGEGIVNNITVYQITKTGLALQATIKGTKFWRYEELN